MKHFIKITIVMALLFQVHPVFSEESTGFVLDQFVQLEKRVRKNTKIKDIAEYLTQVKTFEEWPEDMDHNLKLYIAIKWFDKNYMTESAKLLDGLEPFGSFSDLWMYYRSVLLIHRGYAKKSLPLIAKLEGKYSDDINVLTLKSLYLTQSGDLMGALDVMDKLVKKNKKDGDVYLQRGTLHMIGLSYDLAVKDYKMALKYLAKHQIEKRQQAYLQIGLIYWKIMDKKEDGRDFLKKGVELNPDSDMVRQVSRSLQEQ